MRSVSADVPDTILPIQFFTRVTTSDTPEKRLILAVLVDAVLQLQRGDERGVIDAQQWIRDETEEVPISFSQACEALGIEAPLLARGLLSWRTRHEAACGARPIPRGR